MTTLADFDALLQQKLDERKSRIMPTSMAALAERQANRPWEPWPEQKPKTRHGPEELARLLRPQEVPFREEWPIIKRLSGKIGAGETLQRVRWQEKAPFVGDFLTGDRLHETRHLLDILETNRDEDGDLTPERRAGYLALADRVKAEGDYRAYLGQDLGGQVAQILADMAPWVLEFAATQGVAGAVSGTVRAGVGKALGVAGKEAIGAAGRTGAKAWGAALAARAAGGLAGSATRVALMPGMVYSAYEQARLDGMGENSAFVQALAHSFIEIATEQMGGEITAALKAPVKGLANLTPRGRAAVKWLQHVGQVIEQGGRESGTFARLLKAGQWHGLIGELGEEQAARILHWTFGTEDADLLPTGEEFLAQVVAFSVPGTAQAATRLPGIVSRAVDQRRQRMARLAALPDVPSRRQVAEALEVPVSSLRMNDKDRAKLVKEAKDAAVAPQEVEPVGPEAAPEGGPVQGVRIRDVGEVEEEARREVAPPEIAVEPTAPAVEPTAAPIEEPVREPEPRPVQEEVAAPAEGAAEPARAAEQGAPEAAVARTGVSEELKGLDATTPEGAAKVLDVFQERMTQAYATEKTPGFNDADYDLIDQAYRTAGVEVPTKLANAHFWALPGHEAEVAAAAREAEKVRQEKTYVFKERKPPEAQTIGPVAKTPAGRIKGVAGATGSSTRYTLDGVWIDKGWMVATDGRRMHALKEASDKPTGVYQVSKTGVIGTPIEGAFPRWKEVVPAVAEPDATFDPSIAWQDVRSAGVVTSDEARAVLVVRNSDGSIGFAAHNPNVGNVEIGVRSEESVPLVGVNPAFFADALKFLHRAGAKEVELFVNTDKKGEPTVMLLRGLKGDALAVLMPLEMPDMAAELRRVQTGEEPAEVPTEAAPPGLKKRLQKILTPKEPGVPPTQAAAEVRAVSTWEEFQKQYEAVTPLSKVLRGGTTTVYVRERATGKVVSKVPGLSADQAGQGEALRRYYKQQYGKEPIREIDVATQAAAPPKAVADFWKSRREASRAAGIVAAPKFVVPPPPVERARTPEGRELFKHLPRIPDMGPRTIIDSLAHALGTRIFVSKTQVSVSRPEVFREYGRVVYTQALTSGGTIHGIGHAVNAILLADNRAWHAPLDEALLSLTDPAQYPDTRASKATVGEGVSELVRRYIDVPESLPAGLAGQFEALVAKGDPRTLAILRDHQAAWQWWQSQDAAMRLPALAHDVPPINLKAKVAGLVGRTAYGLLGQTSGLRRMMRLVMHSDKAYRGFRSNFSRAYQSVDKAMRELRARMQKEGMTVEGMVNWRGHTGGEVDAAMRGRGFEIIVMPGMAEALTKEVRTALEARGFSLPDIPKVGERLHLSDSWAKLREPFGKDWPAFSNYMQWLSVLERYTRPIPGTTETQQTPYPGMDLAEYSPKKIEQYIAEMDAKHPDWREKAAIPRRFFDAPLIASFLTGEKTLTDIVAIKEAYEDYAPLRRIREGQTGAGTGGGAFPSSGIMRIHGSLLPFDNLDAQARRATTLSLAAFAENAARVAMLRFIGEVQIDPNFSEEVKRGAARLMLPLEMDTRPGAILSQDELAHIINRQRAKDLGLTSVKDLPEDQRAKPEDMFVNELPIWRGQRPRAQQVISTFGAGGHRYWLVPDPVIYQMIAGSGKPYKFFKVVFGDFIANFIKAPKRLATGTLLFGLRNVAARDPVTAQATAHDWPSLIRGLDTAVGLVHQILGTTRAGQSEFQLMTNVPRHFAEGGQHEKLAGRMIDLFKAAIHSFAPMVKEGIVFSETEPDQRPSRAGIFAQRFTSVPTKIGDMFNWASGGWFLSSQGERMPRQGRFDRARKAGLSIADAQFAADESTGAFGIQPGNATLRELFRGIAFSNAAVRIFDLFAGPFMDPSPRMKLWHIARLASIPAASAALCALKWLILRMAHDDDEFEEEVRQARERPDNMRWSYADYLGLLFPFDRGIGGALSSFGWNAAEDAITKNPLNVKVYAEEILTRAAESMPVIDVSSPMFLDALVDTWRNQTWYGDPIVPEWLEKNYPNDPDLRTFPETPDLYDRIGRGLKVSPLQVRYLMRQWFSRTVMGVLDTADSVERGKPIERADLPVMGGMFAREARGWSSRSMQSVQVLEDEYISVRNRLKDLQVRVERGQVEVPDAQKQGQVLIEALGALNDAHRTYLTTQRFWRIIREERKKSKPDYDLMHRTEREMTRVAAEYLRGRSPTQK